jgi:hypothetical protein
MSFLGRPRRRLGRWGLLGLVVGLAMGATIGAVASSRPTRVPDPRFLVLHPASVLVGPDAPVSLIAGVLCRPSGSPACEVVSATAHVTTPRGTWRLLPGAREEGGYRFTVPAELVPDDGFSYWLEFETATGASATYPSGGRADPIRVRTTAGLPIAKVAAFSWRDLSRPDATALFLPYGSAPGQVGRTPGGADLDPLGPSSFAVGPDGGISVVDWVNDRIEVFSRRGRLARTLPTPVHRTMDLAVDGDGSLELLTLGAEAVDYRVSATDGRVLGSSRITVGVATRVEPGPAGPSVLVGPGQWASAREPGGSLTASDPTTGSAVSGEVGTGRLAVAWTRPDGTGTGAVLRLPPGVRVGSDYFVHLLPDGGALIARGLWDDTHTAVGVFRLDADGRPTGFSLLPEPTTEQDARLSTVRWQAPGAILVAYARPGGVAIERFEVVGP